jgi:amiloride-sensitive sodium channel
MTQKWDMSLKTYCEQTSLHGWYYIANDRKIWRAVWSTIVLASVGVASIFIYKAAEEFTKSTVVTTIHSTTEPLSEVYFPAVTVCNINQVSSSF